ncbi:TPA: hypothetical protein IE818_004212 [Escherichia coli]|nr:hypothetical protein [Escherichia coli]
MYDFYKHRDHLVRFDGKIWKDVTQTNKPKFTHQQLASRFDIWTEAQKDNGDFEFIRGFDYAYEDDLKDAIKLIENFNSIKSGDKHKANGNRYDKDLIIDAITKGQSQSYISEKYGLSRSQYYRIKASV